MPGHRELPRWCPRLVNYASPRVIEVAKVVTSRVIREVPLHPPAAHNASAGHRLHPLMDLIFMDLAFMDLAFLDLAFPYRSQP